MSSIINHKTETLKQSNTKIQSFVGCQHTDDSKYNSYHKKTSSTMTQLLKSIFALKNKKKQQNTKQTRRKSIQNKWKPSLQFIYTNESLLNTLINFMESSYNSENILFLLAIQKLKQTTKDINSMIISIYNTYIIPNAQLQINLSYQCLMNILSKRNQFITFDIEEKHLMFDKCVSEIELLVMTSILPLFYRCSSFQNYCESNYINSFNKNIIPNNRPFLSVGISDSTTKLSTDVNTNDYLQ